ncbi:MAG: phosphatidate cytidylyltransferase [Chitinophagaceae bacterium]
MALNLATFRTRALTALVFVAVIFTGLLWNQWSFFILFSIVHFGCWIEFQKLLGRIYPVYATINTFHKYGVIVAGWFFMMWCSGSSLAIGSLSLHAIGLWGGLICMFLLPVTELLFAGSIELKNIGYSLLGLLYISLSWGLMMSLRTRGLIHLDRGQGDLDPGILIPIGLICSIWINDTMAYIVGSLIGKTPFSKISPKKTWEGTAGGAILCVVAIGIAGHYIAPFNIYAEVHWVVIASIAAVIGTAGDLLESKLKRMADVKDSGSIMPGHGGFLDRFDSLLLATPFVWLYVILFMQ